MRTAAVVVGWRNPGVTADALRSISTSNPPVDVPICVSQELDEDDVEVVSSAIPTGGHLITLDENIGFAAAANRGIAAAIAEGASWILLMNNDATITPDCVRRCVAAASAEPYTAVLSPAIALAGQPERLWFGGGRHSSRFGYTRHRRLRASSDSPGVSGDTDYVPGCCALISAKAWKLVGAYREDYFVYYEDVEWCYRARAAGWRVRYLAEVLCHHRVGVSSQQSGYLGLSENTAYYLARNPLRFALDSSRPTDILTRTAGSLAIWGPYNAYRILRTRNVSVAGSYLRGIRDGLVGNMGARPLTR